MNINFSQVREDPEIETYIIHHLLLKTDLNLLIIGSGGCTLLGLLDERIIGVDVIDQNYQQIYLIQLKMALLIILKDKKEVLHFFQEAFSQAEFDILLNRIKNCLTEDCYQFFLKNFDAVSAGINQSGKYERLFKQLVEKNSDNNNSYDKVFSTDNLIKNFGDNAVQNTKKSFSEHFKNVIETYEKLYTFEENYFYHQIMKNSYHIDHLPKYFSNMDNIEKFHKRVKFVVGDFLDFLKRSPSNKYHFVHTSNITDWMKGNQLKEIMEQISRVLKIGGFVVMRRLLADYSLADFMGNYFQIIDIPLVDRTHFYSEVVVGKNSNSFDNLSYN